MRTTGISSLLRGLKAGLGHYRHRRNPILSLPGAALTTGLIAVALAAFSGTSGLRGAASSRDVAQADLAAPDGLAGAGRALSAGAATPGAPGEPDRLAAARAVANRFAATMRAELDRSLAASGPAASVAVCRERASAVAAALASETGWRIRRTGLRVRNPADVPDVWETGVLQRFAARRAAGEDAAALEFGGIEPAPSGSAAFRYMKAIRMETACVACHGKALDPAAAETIARFYPHDEATGFAPDDVIGAFTIIMPVASDGGAGR